MTSIEMIVMYSPLIIHSKAWTPMTRAIHLWARRAQNAGFIGIPACDGQRCGKALLPVARRRFDSTRRTDVLDAVGTRPRALLQGKGTERAPLGVAAAAAGDVAGEL